MFMTLTLHIVLGFYEPQGLIHVAVLKQNYLKSIKYRAYTVINLQCTTMINMSLKCAGFVHHQEPVRFSC